MKKGYGGCLLVKSDSGKAEGAGSANHEKKTATTERSVDEQPMNTEGIRTPRYQIIEGWAFPCST